MTRRTTALLPLFVLAASALPRTSMAQRAAQTAPVAPAQDAPVVPTTHVPPEPEPTGRVVTLAEAIAAARVDPPSVRNALSRVALADAQIDIARAQYYPSLTLSSSPSVRYSNQPITPTLRLDNASVSIDATAQARMTLYDFGRTAANVSAAQRGRSASQEDAHLASLQAMASVAAAYFSVLSDQETISSVRATIAQREARLRIAIGQVETGVRPPIDRVRAQVDLDSAELDLITAQARDQTDRAAMAAALGLDPVQSLRVVPVGEDALAGDDDPAHAAQAAVRARPEFLAAVRRLEQAESQREAAVAGLRPTLAANASGSVAYTQVLTGNGLAGVSESAGAGLQLVWSAFDPTVRANIRVTEANIAAARAALDAQSLTVRTAAVQAAINTRSARASLDQAERVAAGAAANLELATGRYQSGVSPLLEIVDAQAADATARINVVRARLSLQLARVQLLAARGELDRLAR